MSKSEGHFSLAREILDEVDAETVRFYLLSTHYRSPIEFSRERLAEADRALDRFRNFFHNAGLVAADARGLVAAGGAAPAAAPSPEARRVSDLVDNAARLFEEAMDDDFNTALALAHLFDLVKELNAFDVAAKPTPEKAALLSRGAAEVRRLGGILGLFQGLGRAAEVPEAVLARVRERDAARRAKEWARADSIREALRAEGYLLEDRATGTSVKIVRD
jgi:cysteinyl-tRNA synthetase